MKKESSKIILINKKIIVIVMNLYLIFCFLISNLLVAQNTTDYSTIVSDINNYNFDAAQKKIIKLDDNEAKELFTIEIQYQTTGVINRKLLSLNTANFNFYLIGIYYIYLGDYYSRFSKKFSKQSFQLYLRAYQLGLQNNNVSLQQESIRHMLFQFQSNEMNFEQFTIYSEKYSHLKTDPINTFWADYFSIFKKFYEKFNLDVKNNFSINEYEKLSTYSKNPFLKGKVYQMMEIYYNHIYNFPQSDKYISKAIVEYNKVHYFYSQKAIFAIKNNIGINYLNNNQPKKAIAILREVVNSSFIKNDFKKKYLAVDGLFKAYTKIKNNDSTLYYLSLRSALEDTLKREENAIAIHEIDTKYSVREKNQQIVSLKSKFNQNKILYLSLIFGVFLLALYSFVRWKKEDKMRRNALLETQSVKTEYFQTVEELKKTKQLVIQDHIILKNKSKVNLDDLLYIKAEDHYLQLVTNKKNEFVREKLTEIILQLPPNFVKCHRSFIVNKNHVKKVQKAFLIMNDNSEIPISRGFKIDL